MIFDSIQNRENYKDFPLLYRALCFLSELPEGGLPAPGTDLIPGVLFCNPVTLTTRPEAECRYEAHRNFIDVHYIVSGVEGIATADPSALTETEGYSEEKDIAFYQGPEDGRYDLKPGQFMVCFPSDAHKVCLMKDRPGAVEKVVFKIKAEVEL